MFRKILLSLSLLSCFMLPVHAEEALREDETALIERYETSVFKLGSCDATEYPKMPKSFIEAARQAVSYTHLRAHETRSNLVCRLLLEKNFF